MEVGIPFPTSVCNQIKSNEKTRNILNNATASNIAASVQDTFCNDLRPTRTNTPEAATQPAQTSKPESSFGESR